MRCMSRRPLYGLVVCVLLGACAAPATDIAAPPPIWCYRSLADPVCYPQPLARDRERLIGQYEPGPYPPVVSEPYPAAEAEAPPPTPPAPPPSSGRRR